jgi:hypothetical protein
MRALNDVVESGKVRDIGASSMAAGTFRRCRMLRKNTDGINSSPCKIITSSLGEKKSAKCILTTEI